MRRVLTLLLLLTSISAFSIHFDRNRENISGNREVISKTREIDSFNEIKIEIGCKIILKQGDKEELILKADENLHEVIETEVHGNKLYITTDYNIIRKKTITIYLTIKDLKEIDIQGAAKLSNTFELKLDELSLDISGAADIELDIECERLEMDLSGAVNADFTGRAIEVIMQISGTGNIDAYDLEAKDVSVDFSGFGKASVYASDNLEVDVSGMGMVSYVGRPNKIIKNVSGLGIVKDAN